MSPFHCAHPTDMFVSARDELFIISAMIETAVGCGDTNFSNSSETMAVLQEARIRVRSLITECGKAADFSDRLDLSRQGGGNDPA